MHKILLFLMLFSITAYGQNTAIAVQQNIQNTKTNKHVLIPGTRLFIVPPPDFTVAKTFIGLQKQEHSGLSIMDIVGGNFYSNAATFSKQEFESKGVRVYDYQEIKVGGYPAKFISMQGDLTVKAYALVFGDSTFSTMIMGFYPVVDETTGKQMLASLNTIFYDKARKINPFETAHFTLNEKSSKFKFSQYSANIYLYTVGGVENNKDANSPIVLVMQLPKEQGTTLKSLADMMIAKTQQYGLTNPVVKNVSTEKINGYDTYQAEVYGQIKEMNSVIYQCFIAKGDMVITIQGIAKEDINTNIEEFKKLAATIHIK